MASLVKHSEDSEKPEEIKTCQNKTKNIEATTNNISILNKLLVMIAIIIITKTIIHQ